MIMGYFVEEGRLRLAATPLEVPEHVVWFDVLNPMPHDKAAIEAVIGVEIPDRAKREQIEESSRLYSENGAIYMTITLPARVDQKVPEMAPVTFILAGRWLVSVHDHEPRAFQTFPARAEKAELGCHDSDSVLIALLEAIVERLADILERIGQDIEQLSRSVLRADITGKVKQNYRAVLQDIGHHGELLSRVLDSLVSLERMTVFMVPAMGANPAFRDSRSRVKTLQRDTTFLTEHAGFLSQKINFLLDATLGMISIEQNATIKIFSVAAVVFLPPTLIASIYGMNFAIMPELSWAFGYPFALGLMVASAIVSFWVFKRQGWL